MAVRGACGLRFADPGSLFLPKVAPCPPYLVSHTSKRLPAVSPISSFQPLSSRIYSRSRFHPPSDSRTILGHSCHYNPFQSSIIAVSDHRCVKPRPSRSSIWRPPAREVRLLHDDAAMQEKLTLMAASSPSLLNTAGFKFSKKPKKPRKISMKQSIKEKPAQINGGYRSSPCPWRQR